MQYPVVEPRQCTNSPETIDKHSNIHWSPGNIVKSIENPPKTIVNPNESRNRKDSVDHNICPICELEVTDSDSIECNVCDMWLHKYCTTAVLSDELFDLHTNDIDMPNKCHLCTLLDQDDCTTTIQDECHRSFMYFDLETDREGVMTPSMSQPINDLLEDQIENIREAGRNSYTSKISSTLKLNQFEATIKSQLDILKIEMQHKLTIHELDMKHHLELSELKAKIDRMSQQGISTVSSVPQQQFNAIEPPAYHQPLATAPPVFHRPITTAPPVFHQSFSTAPPTLHHPTTTQFAHIVHPHIVSHSINIKAGNYQTMAPANNHHHANFLYQPQEIRNQYQRLSKHWLYSCDKHQLQEVNDTHICEAKSVDDDLDTEILVKNRGFGGTAVFWRKDIDRVVRFTSDGNDRIVVLTFNFSNNPLCLIGVYMPSHNKHGDELYIDILSQIEEIIEKYHHTGDDRPRDKRFKCLIENNGLCLTDNYPKVPTFYHHNGVMSSQIDYIIHKDCDVNFTYTVKIEDRNPLNVSDHTLLIAVVPGIIKGSQSSLGKKQIIKRPNWARCDKEKYQEAIRESVANIDTVNLENASIEISKLVDLLHSADNLNLQQNFSTEKLKVIEIQNKIIDELETGRNIEIDNTNVLEVQE
ncbi:unnamed protein product [Mytilus coruscus]|uniref:PHD-type domain-containing protein n=1 Tax=Mytilus coruscus TaxID=42192 RepID=A0A6J8C2D3_MYTCO|nr:unnamed protein product [Mytilus coruscus]